MTKSGKKAKTTGDNSGPCHRQGNDSPPQPLPVLIPQWREHEDLKFETQTEHDEWYVSWRERKCWPEREMLLDSCSGRMKTLAKEVCDRREISLMLAKPSEINLSWVREWYAKLTVGGSNWPFEMTIRKVVIDFNPNDINDLFSIPASDHETYEDYVKNKADEIYRLNCRYLFKDGIVSGWPQRMRLTSLKPEYDFWFTFVNMYLVPTASKGEIHPGRYTMLHRLLSDEVINFGDVIKSRMMIVAKDKSTTLLMPYPSLITALCHRANVPLYGDDVFFSVPPALNFGARIKRQAAFSKLIGVGTSGVQDVQEEDTDESEDDQPKFVPTHQDMMDYSYASNTVSFAESWNSVVDRVNAMPSNAPRAAPMRLRYHGPPFGGFRMQHPKLFATDSTAYIPEFHVPYVHTGQPYPTFYDAPSQFTGMTPASDYGSGQAAPTSYHNQFFGDTQFVNSNGMFDSTSSGGRGGGRFSVRRSSRQQYEQDGDDMTDVDYVP